MKNFFFLAFILMMLLPQPAAAAEPEIGKDVILMQTEAGPLLFGLYVKDAPKAVHRAVEQVRLGRVSNRVVRSIDYGVRLPVSASNSKIPTFPKEAKNLRHERGVLSLASERKSVGFSILLAPMPERDKDFTVFGRMIDGEETLQRITRWPLDDKGRPDPMLSILWTKMVPLEKGKVEFGVLMRQAEQRPLATPAVWAGVSLKLAKWALCLVVVISCAAFVFSRVLTAQGLLALHMLTLLFGMIPIIIIAKPYGPWLGGLAFVVILAIIRLMSVFENYPAPPKA